MFTRRSLWSSPNRSSRLTRTPLPRLRGKSLVRLVTCLLRSLLDALNVVSETAPPAVHEDVVPPPIRYRKLAPPSRHTGLIDLAHRLYVRPTRKSRPADLEHFG